MLPIDQLFDGGVMASRCTVARAEMALAPKWQGNEVENPALRLAQCHITRRQSQFLTK